MDHESSQFDVGYTVTSDKYCNWFQHLLVDWWLNDRSILLRFFWFQTLKLRVTEFRFICWLIEMRWVGTFKPHLILSNLLIVVIQLTIMEFSSWHPIKTPLISIGPFDIYRIQYLIACSCSMSHGGSMDRQTVIKRPTHTWTTSRFQKPSWTLRISVDTVF